MIVSAGLENKQQNVDGVQSATGNATEAQERNETINVVVLAGGVNTIPLYDGYVPGYKALLPCHGKPSIEYVLDALCAVKTIGHICIAGPRAALEETLSDRHAAAARVTIVEGGETFLDSLVIGLEHFRSSRAVLFVTADLPLLTPAAINDFLAGCAATSATGYAQNIRIAAVSRSRYTGAYRKFTKPFNKFRDISMCHGNLFLADTDLLGHEVLREQVARLYDGRKTGLSRLAFGWQVALTFLIGVDLLHVITLRRMTQIASRRFGVGIVPIMLDYPEVTIDVDEADDYQFVLDELERVGKRERPIPCT